MATRDASSVEELDVDLDAVLRGSGAGDGADAGGGAATAADDPTEVAVADAHVEAGAITTRCLVDADRVGVVDDRADDGGEHRSSGRCHDVVGGVGHFEPLNCSIAPEISSSLRTRSVGWAPWLSHLTALSLST